MRGRPFLKGGRFVSLQVRKFTVPHCLPGWLIPQGRTRCIISVPARYSRLLKPVFPSVCQEPQQPDVPARQGGRFQPAVPRPLRLRVRRGHAQHGRPALGVKRALHWRSAVGVKRALQRRPPVCGVKRAKHRRSAVGVKRALQRRPPALSVKRALHM